nr:MAG TPA: hypothetical protein [Caudoviricetes sp.]
MECCLLVAMYLLMPQNSGGLMWDLLWSTTLTLWRAGRGLPLV